MVCASVAVSAAVLWGLCHAVVERRLICKAILAFIKGLSTFRSKKNQAEVKYLDEQVALEKKNLAQKVPRASTKIQYAVIKSSGIRHFSLQDYIQSSLFGMFGPTKSR